MVEIADTEFKNSFRKIINEFTEKIHRQMNEINMLVSEQRFESSIPGDEVRNVDMKLMKKGEILEQYKQKFYKQNT